MSEGGSSWYRIGYWICWVVVFLGSYIYCIATYGFLLGVGLGWLPSAIAATVVSIFWPVIPLGVLLLILYLMKH